MKKLLRQKNYLIHHLLFTGVIGLIFLLTIASDLPKPAFLKEKTIHFHNRLEPDSAWLYVQPLFDYYIENHLHDSIWGIMKYHIRAASKTQGPEKGYEIFNRYKSIFHECYANNIFLETLIKDEQGMLFLEEFRIEEAQKIFLENLTLRKKILSPTDSFLAINHSYLAESYSYAGEYTKAEEEIEKAIQIRLRDAPQNDRMLAVFYLLRAGTKYDKTEQTENDFLTAIDIFKKLYGDDFKGLSICYNNLSNLYYDSGRIEDAVNTIMISIKNHEKDPQKNRRALATNYANLSRFYWGGGDWEHGFYYSRKAMLLFEQNAEEEKYFLFNLYDQMGGYYQVLGYYNEAELFFEKGRAIKEELLGTESMPYSQYWYNMGRTLYYQNRIYEALECYRKSAEIRKTLLGDDNPLFADCLSDIGDCYRKLGDYPKSLEYFSKSTKIYLSNYGKYHQYHIGDLANQANIYALMNDHKRALSILQECLSLITSGKWYSNNILENPPTDLLKFNYALNDIVINKHQLLKKTGIKNKDINYLIAAYNTLDISTSKQNKSYYELGGLQNRKDLVQSMSEIYRYKAELCYELFEMSGDLSYLDELFKFSENSKAFNLRDLIRGNKAATYAGIPDSLVAEEKKLNHQIKLFMENEYDPEDDQLKKQYVELKEKLDNIEQIFRDSFPQYADIRYDLEPLTRQQTQQALGANECLVVMMKGIENYYKLFISKNNFHVSQCGQTSMIDGCIDEMYLAMNNSKSKEFAQASYFLYNVLFGDISEHLLSDIYWIPDAYLHQLNPEILIRELPGNFQNSGFKELLYLLHDYDFIVNHSVILTLEWHHYTRKEKARYQMLGISPFSKTQDDKACTFNDHRLIRLPWSEKAINELSNQFMGNFLSGNQATKAATLPYLSHSNILHFGTHAITNNDEPLRSGLVLACDQDDPSWEARNLSAAELYGIPLNAKLAVLTACQTGKGKFESGEGVISLARAFNFAGCPSLLMTLWSVDDRATSEIALQFYQNLRQQLTISNSLRAAKKEYLRQHTGDLTNPVYWAGMVMIGQNQIVLMETKSSLISYGPGIVAGIAVLLIALFFLSRKKKKKIQP